MVADTLIIILILVTGICLYLPYLKWPADTHFGVFSLWAVFRENKTPIPEELIRGNQGFSRIFLHYVMLGIQKISGPAPRLLIYSRLFQAGLISAAGILVFLLAKLGLGSGLPGAMAAGLIYVFTATRPALDPVRINGEPYYALFVSVAVLLLLITSETDSHSPVVLFTAFSLICFSALNTKIIYLLDYLILGLVYMISLSSYRFTIIAWILAGLAASGLFYFIFRRYLNLDRVKDLAAYAKWAKIIGSKIFYKNIWRHILKPTPLPLLLLLMPLGLALNHGGSSNGILMGWILSSILILFAQRRFCNYHFLILLPPAALMAAPVFDLLFRLDPYLVLAASLLIADCLCEHSTTPLDIFRSEPAPAMLTRALGTEYYKYFDVRLEEITAHHDRHPGPFIPWGICPQLFVLTGRRPCLYAGVMTRLFYDFFSMETINRPLLENIEKEPHNWLYDISDNLASKGAFNPLTFYTATGQIYVQQKRLNNIGYFHLREKRSRPSNPGINLFLKRTSILDLLDLEAKRIGPYKKRPLFWQRDITISAGLWAEEKTVGADRKALALTGKMSGIEENNILHLYTALIYGIRGEASSCRRSLEFWDTPSNPYLMMSPALRAVTWYTALRVLAKDQPWPLEGTILDRLQYHEAALLAGFMKVLSEAKSVTLKERLKIRRTLQLADRSISPYDDWRSRNTYLGLLPPKFPMSLPN